MDPAALQVLHHVLDARRQGDPDPVSLPGADLRGAQLMRADLVGADLHGAGLDHAQLAGAKLVKADLRECMLRWADLGGADLTEADLRGADLSWARLEGASLAGADLRGADVNGVVGQPSSFTGATFDSEMAERSGLSDAAVVQLWRAGAEIEDLDNFPYVVKRACGRDAAKLSSDAGPSARRVSEAEMKAVRLHAEGESLVPPSARVSAKVVNQVLNSLPAPSLRTQTLVASDPAPAMQAAPAWKAGDEVMGVTLKRLLGEGNCGQVWQAEDADGSEVVAKMFSHLRAGLGRSLSAYRRGVNVMNRLCGLGAESTGVVPIYSVSLNQLGYVMALAENGSAVDLPALGWKVKQIVDFVEQVASIVKRAHAAGVLHRCLKPSNILLDADLNPMVADFDMVDLPSLASTRNEAAGYASYAAPEELLGQGTQSPTADVYSLGRILHFLLAGERPGKLTEDVPTLDELEHQPAGLVRIVRQCCLRAPEARYQSVDELLKDLARYDDHDDVGIAGGPEANFMPFRVSTLSHETPWLEGEQRSKTDPPRRGKSLPPAAKKRRRGKPDPQAEADAAIGMNRGAEKALGTLGSVVLLASLLVVLLMSSPSSELVSKMRYTSVAGAGLASFLLRRTLTAPLLWRLFAMFLCAGLAYWLNLPSLVR
jgi:serine/threonine protein kinase